MDRQHDFKRHALYPAPVRLLTTVWSQKRKVHSDDRFRASFPQDLTETSPEIRRSGESSMKHSLPVGISGIAFLLILSLSIHIEAQSKAPEVPKQHPLYKLIDLGTFGGPHSETADGGGITSVNALNNQGTFIGWADTATADPYPDVCFLEDCFVSHAFRTRNGNKADLGTLPGGPSSLTTWISPNGLISGISENGKLDPVIPGFPQLHAVLWRDGRITDLGTFDGAYESVANAVNSRGQVAGAALNSIPDADSMFGLGYQTRAFLWENGSLLDLGTLGTGTDAEAALINNRGQVVGWSYTSSEHSDICAAVYGLPLSTGSFVWDRQKGMVNLGSLGGTCTVAMGLNDRGQIVGQSWSAGDATGHAFYWDRAHGMLDLRTLGGDFASASVINDAGDAVGGSYLAGNVLIDATLWRGKSAIDLGTVDGDQCSYAMSINARGQVVGISGTLNCDSPRAFLWEEGGPMVDLNDLVVAGADIQVAFAYTINDRGEIAGLGFLPNGDEHAVLLIPCGSGEAVCANESSRVSAHPASLLLQSSQATGLAGQHSRLMHLSHMPMRRSRGPIPRP
jgi:probable HAF family extracellular repeat protein